MKSRFSTIDITAVIRELLRFVSMRVMNVYDVDNKTYLIRLGKPDDKAVILIESGIRIHATEFEWPKNPAPSGFSMKMRKHLKGRRLESVEQLGVDRIVDLTFGSGEAAYHVILELYDRGNIVLTDYTYTILNILRPRTDQSQDVRFAVREKYPLEAAKQHELPTEERLREILLSGKVGDPLKKLLIPHLDYGPAMLEHSLMIAGFPDNVKIGKGFNITTDMPKLLAAIEEAEGLFDLFQSQNCKGYITKKSEKRPNAKEGEPKELLTYDEFHPHLFTQYASKQVQEFDSFNKAVDEFYSQMESQKIELKSLQQERQALKKLDNIKKDHEKRVEGLQKNQDDDKKRGQLIEMNLDLVDKAILIVRSAIANQIDWTDIHDIVHEAQMDGDPVAMAIKNLKLPTNHITMLLQNPYIDSDFEDDSDDDYAIKPMKVDLDLALSAYANSRKFFEKKKQAAVKEQKTIDASEKALKSAEKKTKKTLKEVATAASINKARKTYWFEKFLWFISSENFLVIGGRDQQQNELIVKRYMKQGDVYVHADLHGASSVIIKNNTGEPVPPKTLNEAGTMAICNSAAWDAKVVTSAWWVYPSQVSKTAPSGEYLTTGSFMIRGKKNYLPPSYLIYGFGLLFKLEESSVFRHTGERKIRTAEDDEVSMADSTVTDADSIATEVTLETGSDDDDDDDEVDSGGEDNDGAGDDDENRELCDIKEVAAEDEESCASQKTQTVGSENNETKSADKTVKAKSETTNMTVKREPGDNQESVDASDNVSTDCPTGVVVSQQRAVAKRAKRETTNMTVKREPGDNQESVDTSDNVSTDRQTGVVVVSQQRAVVKKAAPVVEFPDTEITLHHVKGDKYELARATSNQSTEDENKIFLGDGKPFEYGEKGESTGPKMTAKQRRELKKAKKQQQPSAKTAEDTEEDKVSWLAEESQGRRGRREKQLMEQQQQQQLLKRGQKGKQRKIKEKYGDQDEEERQLRMEILASAGSKKEEKKKKGKKGDDKRGGNHGNSRPQSGGQGNKQQQQQKQQWKKPELVDIIIKDAAELSVQDGVKTESVEKTVAAPPADDDDKQEEEETQTSEDVQTLNSLTGLPHIDDELLFAIPVCAPYNALINYKYKVKLLPGSTKRGKAAKTAINMFQYEKTITSREKDLVKILKDVDMSRNIPGKVKVTAPNLQKVKRK